MSWQGRFSIFGEVKRSMNKAELFETLAQCLLSVADRDCLAGTFFVACSY